MGTTWILSANSSRARLFEVDPHGDTPREVADFANPAGRAHERDLRSDAAGRYYGKGGQQQGHAATTKEDFGEHETERFAESLREYLEHARGENRFGQLWIVAGPSFLGHLRRNFHKPLMEMVELAVDKDLTMEPPRELFAHALAEREAQARRNTGAQT
jgi:protein required for attachment to host cells